MGASSSTNKYKHCVNGLRKKKTPKCQSFETFLTGRSSDERENPISASFDEESNQVQLSFRLSIALEDRTLPKRCMESKGTMDKRWSSSNMLTQEKKLPDHSIKKCSSSGTLYSRHHIIPPLRRHSSELSSNFSFTHSCDSLTEVTNTWPGNESLAQSSSMSESVISESCRTLASSGVSGSSIGSTRSALSVENSVGSRNTLGALSTCSGDSNGISQGDSLMRHNDMRHKKRRLAKLVTRSYTDMRSNVLQKIKRTYSSEDSGFLDDGYETNDTQSQSSRYDTMTNDTQSQSSHCAHFESELTGSMLSFRNCAYRRNIRHLPEEKQTGILVSALESFLFLKFNKLRSQRGVVSKWLRETDNALLQQGWQDLLFLNEHALVMLYVLASDSAAQTDVSHPRDLHRLIMTWLFIAYSYIGEEITYPITNFLLGESVDSFYRRCLFIGMKNSSVLLLLSQNKSYSASMYEGLLSYYQY